MANPNEPRSNAPRIKTRTVMVTSKYWILSDVQGDLLTYNRGGKEWRTYLINTQTRESRSTTQRGFRVFDKTIGSI